MRLNKLHREFTQNLDAWNNITLVAPLQFAVAGEKVARSLTTLLEATDRYARQALLYRRNPVLKDASHIPGWLFQEYVGFANRTLALCFEVQHMASDLVYLHSPDMNTKLMMLARARDYITEQRLLFRPPEGFLSRLGYGFSLVGAALLLKTKHFLKRWARKDQQSRGTPTNDDWRDYLKALERERQSLSQNEVELFPTTLPPKSLNELGSVPLDNLPAVLPLSEANTFKCNVCRDDPKQWVMGERWGSEDYPCPQCNAAEHYKWLEANRPAEEKVQRVDSTPQENGANAHYYK